MRNLDGRRFIGHGGGMVGYLAGLQADTDANLGAIVLQNGMGANPMALARTVLRIADGEATTNVGLDVTSTRDELVGVYESDEIGPEPIELAASKNGAALRWNGREIGLEELDSDLFLAPDRAFDRFPIRVERQADGLELWHGGRRYVPAGTPARRLPEPSAELHAIAGHYRSHNPWTTNFRIVLRGDQPWLIFAGAPDGFDTEQILVPLDDGSYRVGTDPGNPEGVKFDTVVGGHALRAWLSGWPYYRAG
jgi:D-alanyl-D-alanine carboxypeptidase